MSLKNAKCLTASASIFLFILSEFLHNEYLVKHTGMDLAIKSRLRYVGVAKEVFLGYVVIGCVATQISLVISILCSFIICMPVSFVLYLIDG